MDGAALQTTRIPYKFSTITIMEKRENINDYTLNDFEVHDYKHHEVIKMKMVA
jgi:thymidylate synthase